jgi:hypothetical protein
MHTVQDGPLLHTVQDSWLPPRAFPGIPWNGDIGDDAPPPPVPDDGGVQVPVAAPGFEWLLPPVPPMDFKLVAQERIGGLQALEAPAPLLLRGGPLPPGMEQAVNAGRELGEAGFYGGASAVPAPGSMVLLGLAAALSRRRRRG